MSVESFSDWRVYGSSVLKKSRIIKVLEVLNLDRYAAIIFDTDGTLVNSLPSHLARIFHEGINKNG